MWNSWVEWIDDNFPLTYFVLFCCVNFVAAIVLKALAGNAAGLVLGVGYLGYYLAVSIGLMNATVRNHNAWRIAGAVFVVIGWLYNIFVLFAVIMAVQVASIQ